MISFYPGPSKLDASVKSAMADAITSQILEYNHRSPEFMGLMVSCIETLKEKLEIPKNYKIFFTSSATECWEICSQSFSLPFIHIYNGAFGKKWANYNEHINKKVKHIEYPIHRRISVKKITKNKKEKNIICLTSCETSNTTKVHQKTFHKIRAYYPNSLVFVDATSSMSGVKLNWNTADIWFASVQKCFGLPSGLAVMVCSPKAIDEMSQNDFHYNALHSIHNNTLKFQTTHTPNILNIYLLKKVLEKRKQIHIEHERLKKRALRLKKLAIRLGYTLLTDNSKLQSETVIGLKCQPEELKEIKKKAIENGILLGNGYGPWKSNSFRIANFPAHTDSDFQKLFVFLESFKV